jgi:hypothetical protein
MDTEIWSNHPAEAIRVADQALNVFKSDKEIITKKVQAQKLLKGH